MAHGMKWRRSYCERTLYLRGLWFGAFCTVPGHWPIQFFVVHWGLDHFHLLKVPPKITIAKRTLEKIARKYRRTIWQRELDLDKDYTVVSKVRAIGGKP